MSTCGIYKITSPSDRTYIGQSINIEKRFSSYFKLRDCNKQILLIRSFKKHGVENHLFEIIEICSKDLLNERERYWQEYYDCINPQKGLNCKLTGTKDKSGERSQETKNKIKKSLSLNPHHNRKPVICLITKREWGSLKSCWEELYKNIYTYPTFKMQVSGKVSNRVNIYYKELIDSPEKIEYYLTKYDDFLKKKENTIKEKSRIKMSIKERQYNMTIKAKEKNLKPVLQYSKEGIFIKRYNSIKEAALDNSLYQSNISNCCNKKSKTCGGFLWKFENLNGKEYLIGKYE